MRIDIYDEAGRRVAKVQVDPKSPPATISARGPGGAVHERYLDWDKALDDEGRVRKCPACGCEELYVRRLFPPLTGFVIVLVVALLCLALYGLEVVNLPTLLVATGLLVAAHVAFTLLSPRFLVCYRCFSRYYDAGISRDRQEWDAAIAGKYHANLVKKDRPWTSVTED
jgi:hypothetical protein